MTWQRRDNSNYWKPNCFLILAPSSQTQIKKVKSHGFGFKVLYISSDYKITEGTPKRIFLSYGLELRLCLFNSTTFYRWLSKFYKKSNICRLVDKKAHTCTTSAVFVITRVTCRKKVKKNVWTYSLSGLFFLLSFFLDFFFWFLISL